MKIHFKENSNSASLNIHITGNNEDMTPALTVRPNTGGQPGCVLEPQLRPSYLLQLYIR